MIIIEISEYIFPAEPVSSRRRLLQSGQTLVEYYVQDPTMSTNVMLTTEEQQVFLANDVVHETLQVVMMII